MAQTSGPSKMSRQLPSRSNHGCWTCRLRKKKCDENRPSCLRCDSLQIDCDGYGPKPYWMDRGDLQREHARHMVRIVAQIKSVMRENKSANISLSLGHKTDLTFSSNITSLEPLASPAQKPLGVSNLDFLFEAKAEDRDSSWDLILNGRGSSELSRFSNEEHCRLPTPEITSPTLRSPFRPPTGATNRILCGDREDALFLYYFDHVFYMHCPFYFPSDRQGRSWLFSVLKTSKSSYHAALLLSEHYYEPSIPHKGSCIISARGGNYDLALQELQVSLARPSAWRETLGLAHNVEVLTTILHLLFYESANGGKHNWQVHLAGANTLLLPLVHARIGAIAANRIHTNESPDIANLHPDTSISFLLGFFTYMNIVSCASTRSSQFMVSDHKLLLETDGLNLEYLVGCSNWAMRSIYEISYLDEWKREEEDAHRLSLIELAKHGRRIENLLLSRLASIETNPSTRASVNCHSRQKCSITEITRIFALSAIVYLHVVISGPFPDIPDIKKSVSNATKALQELSDPDNLRYVVWPYCISGSLAAGEQQNAYRELVSVPYMTHGTCLEAFNIMEECWRLRKTECINCDWAYVMKKRGQYILLV